MSDVWGDKDPEDAWDDGDPPAVKLAILERVVASVRSELAHTPHRAEARRIDALRLVTKLEQAGHGTPRLTALRNVLEGLG
jgi:hypothetical protein